MAKFTEAEMARMTRENNRADLGAIRESPGLRRAVGGNALTQTVQLPEAAAEEVEQTSNVVPINIKRMPGNGSFA